jgi:hypothetical protein
MDAKEQTRLMYPFKNDEAFEVFYTGMLCAYNCETERSIELFRKAIDLEPDNTFAYMYLIMSLEFSKNSTEEERKNLCDKWLSVAEQSGNKTQVTRAVYAIDFYKMTPEERKEMFKDVKTN